MESKYLVSGNVKVISPLKRKIDNAENVLTKKANSALLKQSLHKAATSVGIEESRKNLPVFNCRKRILQELELNDTLLLMGETGSGKTTQIPQFLLRGGFTRNGIIGITQPRRVAAITLAKRVAQELSTNIGDIVGFTVRFEDTTTNRTKIRFLTDGILLSEALTDRLLTKYSVIILDEAHERSLNTDVLFGIVKAAQKERKNSNLPPLKIIITSATMNIDHFGKYFNVQGMYLEGRAHPVRVMHAKHPQSDYFHSVLVTIFDIHQNRPITDDILVFLTGREEIESLAQQIRHLTKINNILRYGDLRVFPLYAQLAQTRQLECFLPVPTNTRKIILATNIAETSITIPGIRCVIDCGFVKQKTFSPNSGLDVLHIVRISQAQAWQRTGRAGREDSGISYRTYTIKEMETFAKSSDPEILRANLTSTVLQLMALGIDCNTFDFLDVPSVDGVKAAYKVLGYLGAVTTTKLPQITKLGRLLSQFPLDPRYSKLLLSAPKFSCMNEMIDLVAVLSSENIYIGHKHEMATLAHRKFNSKHGDHLTLLNIFTAFNNSKKSKSWCHNNYFNLRNLSYAQKVRKQLYDISSRLGLEINSCGENMDSVRKCLVTGFFDNLAVLQKDGIYVTVTGNKRAKIHPSSVLFGIYKPAYILFTEIVYTDQNYLREISEISAEWVEEIVPFFEKINKIRK